MPLRRLLPASVALLLLAVACASGGDPGTDDGNEGGAASDAGAGSDGTTGGRDSGSAGDDAAMSTDTSMGVDSSSGSDTGTVESGTDGATDAGADTGTDTGTDAVADTGTDTGVVEASVDTGTDAPVGNPNCATQCSGCCDVNNVCYTTHTDTECPENNSPGMTGQACVDCTAMGPAFHCILDIIVYACFP